MKVLMSLSSLVLSRAHYAFLELHMLDNPTTKVDFQLSMLQTAAI